MDINSQQFDRYNPYSILEDTELINQFKVKLQEIKHVSYPGSMDPIWDKGVSAIIHFIGGGFGVSTYRLLSSAYSSVAHIHEQNLLRYMIRYSIKNRNRLVDSTTAVMLLSGLSAYDVARVRLNLNSAVSFTKALLKGVFTWNSNNFIGSMLKDTLEEESYIPLRITQTTLSFMLNLFKFDTLADFDQIAALSKQYTYSSGQNCSIPECGELSVGRFSDFLDSTVASGAAVVGGKTVRAVYENYSEYENYCSREYGGSDSPIAYFFDLLHISSSKIVQEEFFDE